MADPVAPPPGPQAGMVPVFTPGLGVRMVEASEAPAALQGGARLASEAEHQQAVMEDRYGGVEGHVAPFAAGLLRGGSAGLSDVALGTLGGEGVRRRLLDYQQYSPNASLAGEIAGVAGSALLGNEAGAAGLIGRLGAGAEGAVARGLGGGMLARGAGMAARGAAEGALYETGKAAGDAALNNEALTAEKALAAAGHGALFGAGANALLGGAGAGLNRLLRREGGEIGTVASRAEPGLAQRAETIAESRGAGLGEELQKGADVKTIKALGGSAGDVAALERNTAGGFRKVAQDIRSDVEASTGKSIGLHSRESLHEYATARVEDLGDKLGGMLKKLDESGSGIAPDVQSFAAKVRSELVAPNTVTLPTGQLVAKPGTASTIKAAESWLDQVEGAFGHKAPTFTEWQQARRALDKDINFASRNASPEMGALKQIRGMMETELETAGEAAAKNVGSSFADEYQATKSLYQSVRKAQELTERGVARQLANNSFGLGATIGAATGLASGGPIGGIAMGLAGKFIKDRGDMLAADLLHRAANLAGVQRLASKADAAISKGIAGLLGTKPLVTGATEAATRARAAAAPLGVALSGNLHRDFDKVRSATVQLSTNPMAVTDKVAAALGPEATKSPALAAALTRTMVGDVAYLASKLPPPRTDPFSLQPHLQPETRASDAAKHEFLEAAKALDDPTIMLRQAKAGALTPVTVETLKERRPEIYGQMRTMIAQSLATSTTELPYARRIQLGIMLELPTDQTLAPDFVRDIQATYAASDKAAPEPSPPKLASIDVSPLLMTSTQSAGADGKVR